MSPLPKRVGHAEREVLFKLLALPGQKWDMNCQALYENRQFTADLLDRLVRRGFVEQTGQTYWPTYAGIKWASSYSVPR